MRARRTTTTKGVNLLNSIPIGFEALFVISLGVLMVFGILAQLNLARMREVEYRLTAEHRARTRDAQESLDTMIQRSQGLILVFQGIVGELPIADPMRVRMESALDQAEIWLHEARERAIRPTPTESLGDVAFALSRASRQLFANGDVRFSTVSSGEPQLLQPRVAEEVYRIGVEALTNVLHHADASQVEVEVTYEGPRFRLSVRDDGRGLDRTRVPAVEASHHTGFERMHQAARSTGGRFRIWSRQAAGTEVELVVAAPRAYCHMTFVPSWLQATVFRQLAW